MARIALVGYRNFPDITEDDIIVRFLPRAITSLGHEVCYKDIVEDRGTRSIKGLVEDMLESNPDILNYTNYRDYKTGTGIDEAYINEVKKRSPRLPILLLSGRPDYARPFARKHNLVYMAVPPDLEEYESLIDAIIRWKKLS